MRDTPNRTRIITCGECGEVRFHYAKGLCALCYSRYWHSKPDIRAKDNARSYRRKIESRYGITLEWLEDTIDALDNRCMICHQPPLIGRLHVDHDHSSGVVRGLLCNECNAGLARFKDSPELLRAAAMYLDNVSVDNQW